MTKTKWSDRLIGIKLISAVKKRSSLNKSLKRVCDGGKQTAGLSQGRFGAEKIIKRTSYDVN